MTIPEDFHTLEAEIPAVPPAPPIRPLTAGQALVIFFAYIATQLAVGVLVILAIAIFSPSSSSDAQGQLERAQSAGIIPTAILSLLLGGLVVWYLTRKRFSSVAALRETLGLVPISPNVIIAGAGIGLIFGVGFLILTAAFPPSADRTWGPLVTAASQSGWARYGWAFTGLLLAPPVEEFLFRGVLLSGFRRSWGPAIAGVAVVLIFTALHLTETHDYWPAIIAIGVMATATTLARIRTGSLWPSMAVHAGYNFVMVAVALLSAQG